VDFQQPNVAAITLNRVVGDEQSVIAGALHANGQVFLLNSDGVLFTKNASVNTGGLVASTLTLSDADFMAGRASFTSNGSKASLINLGSITAAHHGYVALLADEVSNQGVITARLGTAVLAAGDKISLNFNGNSLMGVTVDTGALNALVENRQAIIADGGTVMLTAKGLDSVLAGVVNNTGEIQAQTVAEHSGHIYLLGDMQSGTVNVAGTLDASAPNGGNGGTIETSAASVKVGPNTLITTAAAHGSTGTWSIDPVDFIIAPSGGDITGATLSSELATTNVSLSSVNGSQGTLGNLNVNDTVSWSSHTLTLTAVNDVDVNAVMTASGTASLDMEPGSGMVNMALSAAGFTGSVNFSGTGTLTMNGQVYTVINSLGTASSSGDGTLQGMRGNLAGHYALGSNIDASATSTWNSGAGFTPIAASSNFTGTFDGLGHTISGLTINTPGYSPTALFAQVEGSSGSPVFLRNIALTNISLACAEYCGGLVGYGEDFVTLQNVLVSGSLIGSAAQNGELEESGMIVGYLTSYHDGSPPYDSKIVNVYSSGTMSANEPEEVGGIAGEVYSVSMSGMNSSVVMTFQPGQYEDGELLGGLVGEVDYGGIAASSFTGTINLRSSDSGTSNTAEYEEVGGLVGSFDSNDAISNSHFSGSILGTCPVNTCNNGDDHIGGLVGENEGPIISSYASGVITLAKNENENVGGLVGDSGDAAISNSYSTVVITAPGSYNRSFGGFIGDFDDQPITNSYATGSVTVGPNAQSVGGFVGYANCCQTISAVYSTGAVTAGAGSTQVGGFAGYLSGTILSNAYATGAVTAGAGSSNIAGFVGEAGGSLVLTNAYASGLIAPGSGSTYVGGLVGKDDGGNTVTASFWDTTSTGEATSALGSGMTTAQMQQQVNFTSATTANGSVNPGWDFGSTWVMYNGNTYPLLQVFMTPLTVTPATSAVYSGTAADTLVYSTTPNMSYLFGTPTLSGLGTGVGTYTVGLSGLYSNQQGYIITYPSTSVTINPLPVTVATQSGATKVYDGTTAAASNLLTITNVVTGDSVTLSGSASLAASGVGNENLVSLTGLSLNNPNYTLTGATPSGAVAVTARPVDVTTVSGATKVYDGTTGAASNLLTITNVLTGDSVTLSGSAVVAASSVGNENLVSLTGLSLNNANYTLTGGTPSGAVAITARPIDVSTVSGASKVYDGTTAAAANLLTITNVVTGDSVTLSGSASVAAGGAGNENLVSLTGLSLNNANYTLTGATPSGAVDITARPVDVTAVSGATKVYDGTIAAASNLLTITNVVTGDSVTLSGSASVAASGVGNENLVSLTGLSLNNANYTLTGATPSGAVAITARPVDVTAVSGATKVYDGTTAAPADLLAITNVVSGDTVTLSGAATLAGSSVGTEDLSGLVGLSLSNPNYTLSAGIPSGSVIITAAAATTTPTAPATPTAPFAPNAIADALTAPEVATIEVQSGTSPNTSLGAQTVAGNVVYTPVVLAGTFSSSDHLAVVSSPSGDEPTVTVSLSQARQMLQGADAVVAADSNSDQSSDENKPRAAGGQSGTTNGTRDVRVPVSRNSLAEIVNGGVKLPSGVEQQLFVVKAN
jgi:filamentous hemagglutinin family protein